MAMARYLCTLSKAFCYSYTYLPLHIIIKNKRTVDNDKVKILILSLTSASAGLHTKDLKFKMSWHRISCIYTLRKISPWKLAWRKVNRWYQIYKLLNIWCQSKSIRSVWVGFCYWRNYPSVLFLWALATLYLIQSCNETAQ